MQTYLAICKIFMHICIRKQTMNEQMLETKSEAITNVRFKNGLLPEQVQKAKELFKKVKLNEVCKKAGVPSATIYNILRDRDNRVELLAKVVCEANNEIKRREQIANDLPL